MPIFDDDRDSRYHVCCFHVRKGSFVIGIIELMMLGILWALYIVNAVVFLGDHPDQSGNGWGTLIGGIIGTVIWVIVTPLMMYGVVKKKPLCLIPHIVAQILAIIGTLIRGILLLVVGSIIAGHELTGLLIGLSIAFLLAAALEIFFVYVIIRCYQYLKEVWPY